MYSWHIQLWSAWGWWGLGLLGLGVSLPDLLALLYSNFITSLKDLTFDRIFKILTCKRPSTCVIHDLEMNGLLAPSLSEHKESPIDFLRNYADLNYWVRSSISPRGRSHLTHAYLLVLEGDDRFRRRHCILSAWTKSLWHDEHAFICLLGNGEKEKEKKKKSEENNKMSLKCFSPFFFGLIS